MDKGFRDRSGGRRWGGILLGLGLLWTTCSAHPAVVLNEVYYDPAGTDTDHEFIELYNNGGASVSLDGYWVEWGGSSFSSTYFLPSGYVIPAGGFFLIGGSQTASEFGVTPDLIYAFTLQNGGTETDGVRITNGAGYYDTLLYDSPNTNNLPAAEGGWDDGQYAPDVSGGHSLQRVITGVDTNYASDWRDNSTPDPTPSFQPVPEAGTLWLFGVGLALAGKVLIQGRKGDKGKGGSLA